MEAEDTQFEALFSAQFDQLDGRARAALVGLVRVGELARSAEGALRGNLRAADTYVSRYRELSRNLLDAAARLRPELIYVHTNGAVELHGKAGRRAGFIAAALEETAAEAPFSRWAAALGLGEGIALHALASLRDLLPNTPPLTPPDGAGPLPISDVDARRFLRAVRHSLNAEEPPLERIQQVFGLNYTELGALFGITRQGAKDWIERGVPGEREDKVATVAAIADLLERKLKTERIPGIARRPADAYGRANMLEMIAQDRHRELLELTRASFDWAAAA